MVSMASNLRLGGAILIGTTAPKRRQRFYAERSIHTAKSAMSAGVTPLMRLA